MNAQRACAIDVESIARTCDSALEALRWSLETLDSIQAPAEIGAHLQQVIDMTEAYAGSSAAPLPRLGRAAPPLSAGS